MSNKYFSGRKGQYIYCDICGQACYLFEAKRLNQYTGRPGLMVCPNDADTIDFGLVPYIPTTEKRVPFSRPNHTDVTNGTAPLDPETSSELGS